MAATLEATKRTYEVSKLLLAYIGENPMSAKEIFTLAKSEMDAAGVSHKEASRYMHRLRAYNLVNYSREGFLCLHWSRPDAKLQDDTTNPKTHLGRLLRSQKVKELIISAMTLKRQTVREVYDKLKLQLDSTGISLQTFRGTVNTMTSDRTLNCAVFAQYKLLWIGDAYEKGDIESGESRTCNTCGFLTPASEFKPRGFKCKKCFAIEAKLKRDAPEERARIKKRRADWGLNNPGYKQLTRNITAEEVAHRKYYRQLNSLFLSDSFIVTQLKGTYKERYGHLKGFTYTEEMVNQRRMHLTEIRENEKVDAELAKQGYAPVYSLSGIPCYYRSRRMPLDRSKVGHLVTCNICGELFSLISPSHYACRACKFKYHREHAKKLTDGFVRNRAKKLFGYDSIKDVSETAMRATRIYYQTQLNWKEVKNDTSEYRHHSRRDDGSRQR